jgi:hypothetical protein
MGMPPNKNKNIVTPVIITYIIYNIFAVSDSFGTNFPEEGPGNSARIKNIERAPSEGANAKVNTNTPIPPIQRVKLLQNNMLRGRISTFVNIVAPVVVNPEAVSNKASI